MHSTLIVIIAPFMRPHLYLDPGSGSFLIQLIVAGVVGAGFIIKAYWKKIKGLFNRSGAKEEDDSEARQ